MTLTLKNNSNSFYFTCEWSPFRYALPNPSFGWWCFSCRCALLLEGGAAFPSVHFGGCCLLPFFWRCFPASKRKPERGGESSTTQTERGTTAPPTRREGRTTTQKRREGGTIPKNEESRHQARGWSTTQKNALLPALGWCCHSPPPLGDAASSLSLSSPPWRCVSPILLLSVCWFRAAFPNLLLGAGAFTPLPFGVMPHPVPPPAPRVAMFFSLILWSGAAVPPPPLGVCCIASS